MAIQKDIIELRLLNLPYVIETINRLGGLQKSREVSKGLRKGGNYLIRQGKDRLKATAKRTYSYVDKFGKTRHRKGQKTGNLRRSMAITIFKGNKGVIAGFRYGAKGGNHAHLVDKGTQERTTTQGYRRGKIIGSKFWTTTREQDTPTAQEKILDGLDRALEKLRNRR